MPAGTNVEDVVVGGRVVVVDVVVGGRVDVVVGGSVVVVAGGTVVVVAALVVVVVVGFGFVVAVVVGGAVVIVVTVGASTINVKEPVPAPSVNVYRYVPGIAVLNATNVNLTVGPAPACGETETLGALPPASATLAA
jgi:hypothetical protein